MADTEHAFPEATYQHLFGLNNPRDIGFADEVVNALQQIDRALLPPVAAHPLGHLIQGGVDSCGALLDKIETGGDREQTDAIDALGHILVYEKAPQNVVMRLRTLLETLKDPERVALVAKLLAIGRDEGFLNEQMRRLDDEDPGVVATAARLLGFGRYQPAIPVLCELVSPDRIYESRYVIWALGEIGSKAALPALEYALGSAFRVVDCLIAMGKIGQVTSIPKLTPMIMEGMDQQRDAAFRALAMILDKNRDLVASQSDLIEELSGLIKHQFADTSLQASGSIRFHMCLCLARLGQKMDTGTVRRYLKIDLDDKEAGDMASYFMHRTGKR